MRGLDAAASRGGEGGLDQLALKAAGQRVPHIGVARVEQGQRLLFEAKLPAHGGSAGGSAGGGDRPRFDRTHC